MANNQDNKTTREPVQKRSIEKKEKIIEAGFSLMCEKGYHGTNTAQIAKAAGVSTGIIYQYFKDKHEIFLEGLKRYSDKVFFPMFGTLDEDIMKKGLPYAIRKIVEKSIDNHMNTEVAHELIMSLTHTDHDIAELFHEVEYSKTESLVEVLINNGFSPEGLNEKIHLSIGLVDNLCHDMLEHNHGEIDYKLMTDIVVDTIYNLLIPNMPS